MYETFLIEEGNNNFKQYFNEFELVWSAASRTHSAGRASGGMVFGIKKQFSSKTKCSFIRKAGRDLVLIEIRGKQLEIVPIYINCNNWQMEFNELLDFFLSSGCRNTMIIGDFNARVGKHQVSSINKGEVECFSNVARNSKDELIDAKGKQLIETCESFDLCLLNGRTKSDMEGEFTYLKGNGCSVIDYAVINGDWHDLIEDMQVGNQIFSDHMPLSIDCGVHTKIPIAKDLSLLPRLIWKDSEANEYRRQLDDCITRMIPEWSHALLYPSFLTSIITFSAESKARRKDYVKKQPWFDEDCFKARKKALGSLNLFRELNSETARKIYLEANKLYKTLCEQKKTIYFNEMANQIAVISNSKEFWAIAKKLNGASNKVGTFIGVDDLKHHFYSMLNVQEPQIAFHYAIPLIQDDSLDAPFEMEELYEVLRKAKQNKAPGEDRVPYEFFQNATSNFLELLLTSLNYIYRGGNIPDDFRKSIIFPIFKKGDPNNAANYRGISFMNTVTKIFTGLLNVRLTKWVKENNKLGPFQAGFREGFSTVDQIFNLTSIAEGYLNQRKKLYAFFIDFRAAFDTVNRNCLFYKLSRIGVSSKFLKTLKSLYKNNEAMIWNGIEVSESFKIEMGVRQGCLLSPMIFSLFLDDITESLPAGIEVEGIRIKALLFADDLVILAESPSSLQLMINKLENYCKLNCLEINTAKSKILIFRNGTGRYARNEKWNYGTDELEVVRSYKYLGITLDHNLSLKKHFSLKLAEAKKAINSTWKNLMSNSMVGIPSKIRVFEAVMRSVMCYGAQVWGGKYFNEVEKLLRFFLKKLFRLPQTTPNYLLQIESGIPPLFVFTLKLNLKYITKVLTETDDTRLTKILAKKAVRSKTLFFKDWENIATKYNLSFNLDADNIPQWRILMQKFIWDVEQELRKESIAEAESSTTRELYKQLNHHQINYLNLTPNLSTAQISLVIRVRGELLKLNWMPHRNDLPLHCSLCNTMEYEDVIHFLGACPILKEIRRNHFGVDILLIEDLKNVLNDSNYWHTLASYCETALSYRTRIFNENF